MHQTFSNKEKNMAHHTARESYSKLTNRLNKHPQGAPPSKFLYKILKNLFNEKEAELVSHLPIEPFTALTASKIWKIKIQTQSYSWKPIFEIASKRSGRFGERKIW